MWNRWTERGRQAIYFAVEEAERFAQPEVAPEHILLGLLRLPDGGAAGVLENLGVAVPKLRTSVERLLERGEGSSGRDMRLTQHTKHLIDLAYEAARATRSPNVGSQHLLLAAARMPEGGVPKLLADAGAAADNVQRQLQALLGTAVPDEPAEQEIVQVTSSNAPPAIGPYSQALIAGGFVFCSGQIPLNPATGQLVPGTAADQARQCLKNLSAVLSAAGSGMERVVKTTIFLVDLADFEQVNAAYAGFFPEKPPARSTVQVYALPKGALIEIEAVALV